jgi:integrase
MSAIRRLAAEMADNGLLDPQTALVISKVSGPRRCGIRLGNWLSLHQVEDLLALPNPNTLKGKRDRAALSVLLGAGLRRGELCALKFDHLQQRDGRWVIADLVGKHERIRTVPVPNWCKAAIDIWTMAAQLTAGYVFRPLNKAGRVTGNSLAPGSVFHMVKSYGTELGIPIAPHDLRRSFAKLAHKGRAALEQIQLSLGSSPTAVFALAATAARRCALANGPATRAVLHCSARGPEFAAAAMARLRSSGFAGQEFISHEHILMQSDS